MIQTIAFYLFAIVVVLSGILCVTARNPVHSVMWLILAFFNAAGLMLLVGAEFIAMLLVIVYVGAVAVLFLFVVMMLDIDFSEMRAGFANICRSASRWSWCWRVRSSWGGRVERGRHSARRRTDARSRSDPEHHRARPADLYALPLHLRGRGAGAAGRADRRDRADAPQARRRAHQNIAKQNQRRPEDATVNMKPPVGQGVEL